MSGISFVHCGDLHLGCRQFNEARRWDDFRDAFSHIIDYSIDNHVDFLLISGDLFHHRNVNAPTLGMATGLLGKLKAAGIEAIAIEGNHDKALYLEEDSWMSFLNQQGYLKLLKPEFVDGRLKITGYDGMKGCLLEREGFRVIGLGYLGATTRQRLEEAAEQIGEWDGFTAVMLHAAVDKLMGQDMAGVGHDSFEVFAGKVDYFALGHIHSRQEHLDFIFNPGAPESVHIDEVRKNQEKGFYHIIVKEGEKTVRFVPSRRRQICYYDVDLTGIAQPSLAMDRVIPAIDASDIAAFDRPMMQINLYGNVDFNSFSIDSGLIADSLKERYSCLAVEVLNNVNLVEAAARAEGSGLDRSSIERFVISGMVGVEKPEFKDMTDDITDLIIRVKNYSLSGISEDDIILAISQVLDSTPLSEAAAAAGEDGAGEADAAADTDASDGQASAKEAASDEN